MAWEALLCAGEAARRRSSPTRATARHGGLAEVLVKGYEDAPVREGAGKNLLVTWVGRPVARPSHIVTCRPQPRDGATPHA